LASLPKSELPACRWFHFGSDAEMQCTTTKPDSKILSFQIGTDLETTELLLESFFILCDDGWHHARCDREIAEYRTFRGKKSKAGKASAEQRKNSRSTPDEHLLNECSTDVQLTNNQEPITNNHKPKVERQRGSRLPADWQPSDEDVAYCQKERPDLQWQRVAENFRDYWLAQAGTKATKLNWALVWKTWVRNEKGARTFESTRDAERRKVIEQVMGVKNDRIIDIN